MKLNCLTIGIRQKHIELLYVRKPLHNHKKFCKANSDLLLSHMGKPGSSHFRDPPLISEESPLKSEAVLIKYLYFWDC